MRNLTMSDEEKKEYLRSLNKSLALPLQISGADAPVQDAQLDSTSTANQNFTGLTQEEGAAPPQGEALPLSFLQRLAAGFASTEEGRENILRGMGVEGQIPTEPINEWFGYEDEPIASDPSLPYKSIKRWAPDLSDLPGDIADEVGPSLPGILSALGGVAGFGAGPGTMIAGGSIGGQLGDAARQNIARKFLGSGESFNPQQMAEEGMWGVGGEVLGGLGTRVLQKLASPFGNKVTYAQLKNLVEEPELRGVSTRGKVRKGSRQAAKDLRTPVADFTQSPPGRITIGDDTGRLDPGQKTRPSAEWLDKELGIKGPFGEVHKQTRLQETSPLTTGTASELLTRGHQRIAAYPETSDRWKIGPREEFRQQQNIALDRIQEKAGIKPGVGEEELREQIIEAGQETLEGRRARVDELFENSKEVFGRLEESLGAPIKIEINRMNESLKDIAKKIGQLPAGKDYEIDKPVREKLESLRSDVGKLETYGELDAFRKAVGNLLDNKEALEEIGKVGLKGHLRSLYGSIAASLEDAVEAAATSRGKVAGMPGTGSRIETGNLEEARALLGITKKAKAAWQDLDKLNRGSAQALLNKPEQLDLIVDILTGSGGSPARIRTFKQTIGAEGFGEFGAGEKGVDAWRNFQREVFMRLRKDSVPDTDVVGQVPIDGRALLKNMDNMGGDAVLKEIFPEETVTLLRAMAEFIQASSVSQRTGIFNLPEELPAVPMNDMFSMMKKFTSGVFDRFLLHPDRLTPLRKEYLTTGVLQGPKSQNIMALLGRLGGQQGVREFDPYEWRRPAPIGKDPGQ